MSDTSCQKISPFALGELDKLEKAYMCNESWKLYDWSQRALAHYESEKQSRINLIETMMENHPWQSKRDDIADEWVITSKDFEDWKKEILSSHTTKSEGGNE